MNILAKKPERFTETAIDDEIVIMRLDNGDFFSLTGTAAVIWRHIDGTTDRDTLISNLRREFDGDEDHIAAEVENFLEQLRAAELIGES